MKLVPEPMISAKDFRRHIRRYQRLALTQPVTIMGHGEPSLVMMSLSEYQRLKRRDRKAYSIDTMTKEEAEELLADLEASIGDLKPTEFEHEVEGWEP